MVNITKSEVYDVCWFQPSYFQASFTEVIVSSIKGEKTASKQEGRFGLVFVNKFDSTISVAGFFLSIKIESAGEGICARFY